MVCRPSFLRLNEDNLNDKQVTLTIPGMILKVVGTHLALKSFDNWPTHRIFMGYQVQQDQDIILGQLWQVFFLPTLCCGIVSHCFSMGKIWGPSIHSQLKELCCDDAESHQLDVESHRTPSYDLQAPGGAVVGNSLISNEPQKWTVGSGDVRLKTVKVIVGHCMNWDFRWL